MKRKDILLLTLLLSQTTSLWAMDEEKFNSSSPSVFQTTASVASATSSEENKPFINHELFKRIQQIIRVTETNFLAHKDLPKVMVIGRSGHGKSTLINLFAGKSITATKGKLDTIDPVPGSKIGHTTISTTTFPSLWKGPDNVAYVDCPGFGDTAGPEQDIVNASAISQFFSGPTKVLLVAHEPALTGKASEFLDLFKYVTKVLPLDQLKDGLSLVITKQGYVRDLEIPEKIKELLEESTKTAIHLMNNETHALLSYLTSSENFATRVSYFPYPGATGEYKGDDIRTKILENVNNLKFIENPQIHFQLTADATNHVVGLARALNYDIEQAIKTGVGQKILNLCSHQIEAYGSKDTVTGEDNLIELQKNIGALKTAYGLLVENGAENMVDFTHPLDRFFNLNNLDDPNVLTEYAKTLVFLKALTPEVVETKDTWVLALQSIIDQVHQLLSKQATILTEKVTDFINGIDKKVLHKCFDIMRSDKAEHNIEQDISTLNEHLDVITKAITALDTQENVEEFAKPLEKFFYDRENSTILQDKVKTFMTFQSLNPEIKEPFSWWSKTLKSPKSRITESLVTKRADLAEKKRLEEEAKAKEALEKQRLEFEEKARREKEEADRVAAEERQKQAAEIARQQEETARLAESLRQQQEDARLAAEAAEKQRLADLEAARLARIEAARIAEEQRQAQAAEMERLAVLLRQQQEDARLAAEAVEKQRLADLETARLAREATERIAEEQRQAQAAEIARLEETQRKQREEFARVEAARVEAARIAEEQRQETARKEKEETERRAAEGVKPWNDVLIRLMD